jgi:hypothetical protein
LVSALQKQHWTDLIIIIGRAAAPFEPYTSLEDSARWHPVFTSSNFATVNCLHIKFMSLASNPQPAGPCPCVYVPQ